MDDKIYVPLVNFDGEDYILMKEVKLNTYEYAFFMGYESDKVLVKKKITENGTKYYASIDSLEEYSDALRKYVEI